MPGATMKVSSQTRDRIKSLAAKSGKSMASVIEEAIDSYEARLRREAYLEGWNSFKELDPEGFADYTLESNQLEQGFTDDLPL